MTQTKAFDQIKVSDEQRKQGSYTIDNNDTKLRKLRTVIPNLIDQNALFRNIERKLTFDNSKSLYKLNKMLGSIVLKQRSCEKQWDKIM